jgi:hypothetical protein
MAHQNCLSKSREEIKVSKERPILFSAPMVRAILEGRKTQTRRICKPGFSTENMSSEWQEHYDVLGWVDIGNFIIPPCPYGQPGERLWVRETWQGYRQTSIEYDEWEEMQSPKDRHDQHYSPVYRADNKNFPQKWFPSIHMPRAFARIDLEITGIRIEMLCDISEQDCWAEGIDRSEVSPTQASTIYSDYAHPRRAYNLLWESINGRESWEANPWVWVIEFKKLEKA